MYTNRIAYTTRAPVRIRYLAHRVRIAGPVAALLWVPLLGADSVRIPRVSRPPRIEDFLQGAEPQGQARMTDFRQREPADGKPASRQTTAYLSYDDKHFYAVFVCKEQAGKVRARMSKREDIFADDFVAVILDTFHDHQRGYEFLVNPLGIQADAIFTEGQGDDMSFDTLWQSEGRLTPDGYIVRIAVPFKSMRFPAAGVQTWGIALARAIPENNETSFWPYITKRTQGFAQQMATLEGLETISPGRNLQFIPYGIAGNSRFLDAPDGAVPQFRSKTEFRGGLDSKVVSRDALTLDVALNPDFSQVESDEPQVTVNQRFEVFFPEKRPFFIENAGYFQTPENLFFSRRIADPEFGARMTGKVGRWLVGALAIDDRAPGQRALETEPGYGDRTGIGVLRVQREFGKQSSVGLLASRRDFASSSNQVVSIDTRLKLSKHWTLIGQAIRSQTRELDGTRLTGPAYYAEAWYSDLHMTYDGVYRDRSPSFRAELGFIPRVDIRQTEQSWSYKWLPAGKHVKSLRPSLAAMANWDRKGRLQDWQARHGFNLELARQTYIYAGHQESFELFDEMRFRKRTTEFAINTDRYKKMGVFVDYWFGRGVNYSPAAGLRPFLGNSTDLNIGLRFRPTARFRLDETYLFSHLSARAADRSAVFNNHIMRSKLNYQFTRALSVRAILDYNAVLPNQALVDLERSKRVTGDILVTYLVNPGTALYAGYTSRRENLAILPGAPPTLGRIPSPDTTTGRQFFVKLSYLFRF